MTIQHGILKANWYDACAKQSGDFFALVHDYRGSTCGAALQTTQQVVVEDITQSPIFIGTEALDVFLGAGVQAVQSTPIISSSGAVAGMLSTHYREPVSPSERDLRVIEQLAREAGMLIATTEL